MTSHWSTYQMVQLSHLPCVMCLPRTCHIVRHSALFLLCRLHNWNMQMLFCHLFAHRVLGAIQLLTCRGISAEISDAERCTYNLYMQRAFQKKMCPASIMNRRPRSIYNSGVKKFKTVEQWQLFIHCNAACKRF